MTTRDRRDRTLRTLERLVSLPGSPPVVVVDDAGSDGTAEAVREHFPGVTALRAPRNLGAAARTLGVRHVDTPYVAFVDDDSWWEGDTLERAAERFEQHPDVGLLCARIVVEPEGRTDPTCLEMAASPLHVPGMPGPLVTGFVCCGAIVRRQAYLEVGGFEERLGVGGEEDLLALDLDAAGWRCVYVDDLVAHHEPAERGDRPARRQRVARNQLWTAWLRRSPRSVLRITARTVAASAGDPAARRGVVEAVRHGGWVLGARSRVPRRVEVARQLVEGR